MINVLLVDDHQIIIDGITRLLQDVHDVSCVGFSNSGKDALEKVLKYEVQVVLLDLQMPEMDGLETCQKMLILNPNLKVIALTMTNERSMIRAMMEAGAKGYLLKNVGKDELITAIHRVMDGKIHYSDDIMETFIQAEKAVRKSEQELILSRREKEILKLIIAEMTTSEIADQLFISQNTVETHRRNIMHKLGARNTAGMVRIAIENQVLED